MNLRIVDFTGENPKAHISIDVTVITLELKDGSIIIPVSLAKHFAHQIQEAVKKIEILKDSQIAAEKK